jgi:hypothetical protein
VQSNDTGAGNCEKSIFGSVASNWELCGQISFRCQPLSRLLGRLVVASNDPLDGLVLVDDASKNLKRSHSHLTVSREVLGRFANLPLCQIPKKT